MTDAVLHTPGRALFVEWLEADRENRTKTLVADAIGVSSSAVGQWASGKAVPGHVYRPALRVLTGIPEDAWVTEDERARVQSALVGAAQAAGSLPTPPKSGAVLEDSESADPAA